MRGWNARAAGRWTRLRGPHIRSTGAASFSILSADVRLLLRALRSVRAGGDEPRGPRYELIGQSNARIAFWRPVARAAIPLDSAEAIVPTAAVPELIALLEDFITSPAKASQSPVLGAAAQQSPDKPAPVRRQDFAGPQRDPGRLWFVTVHVHRKHHGELTWSAHLPSDEPGLARCGHDISTATPFQEGRARPGTKRCPTCFQRTATTTQRDGARARTSSEGDNMVRAYLEQTFAPDRVAADLAWGSSVKAVSGGLPSLGRRR